MQNILKNRWAIVVMIIITLLGVLGLIKFLQIRAAIAFGESFPEPSETVETNVVTTQLWQPTISVVGDIRASREVELRNEVEGIIAAVGFKPGSSVAEGDVLIQLNVAEEKARLAAAEAETILAQQNVKRVSGLANRSAISQQQADNFSAELDVAKANAASLRELIVKKTVVAPFAGEAGIHDFEVGEYLPANSYVTHLVSNLDALWVDFSVPQRYASLAVGTPVAIKSNDLIAQQMSARIIAVEPSISSSSRTLRARAEVNNQARVLLPGAIAQVTTPVGEERPAFFLPSTAVRVDAFGNFVFVLEKDAKDQWRAKRKPVEVVAKVGQQSVVTSGIVNGDIVATTGSFKLREGLLVNVAAERTLTPQTAGSKDKSPNQSQMNSDSLPSTGSDPLIPSPESNAQSIAPNGLEDNLNSNLESDLGKDPQINE